MPRKLDRLLIERQNLEPLAPLYAHRPEVSFIEREYLRDTVALGQHHDRSIGEPDLKIGISFDNHFGARNVGSAERFQQVCAASDLFQ